MRTLILTNIFGKTSIPNKLMSKDVTILEDSSIRDEKYYKKTVNMNNILKFRKSKSVKT